MEIKLRQSFLLTAIFLQVLTVIIIDLLFIIHQYNETKKGKL